MQWLTSKVIATIQDRANVFSVAIQLHRIPSPAERKPLQQIIAALVDEVDGESWAGYGFPPSRFRAEGVATVSVARTRASAPRQPALLALHPNFPELGEPHQFTAVKQVPISKVRSLSSDTLGDPYRDHVAVWLPEGHAGLPDVVDEKVLGLLPKLKEKLSQTKSPGCYRILVVDTWTAGARFELTTTASQALERELLANHADVAGVLMVTRRFSEARGRHRYEMRSMPNDALRGDLLKKWLELEAELLIPPASV